VVTPLLQEIRVASRLAEDFIQRITGDLRSRIADRVLDGVLAFSLSQWTDRWKIEQPFGVRFRIPCQAGQLRQPGTKDNQRQGSLGDLVQRTDQGAQVGLRQILHFVDEDTDWPFSRLRRQRNAHQELREIGFQVSGCGGIGRGFNADREISIRYLEGTRKGAERGHGTICDRSGSLDAAEPEQEHPELWCEQLGQAPAFGGFDHDRVIAFVLGHLTDSVQQYRFSHTAKPQQHLALRVPTESGSHKRDACILDNRITPCEFWGPRACTGSEGVQNRIHQISVRES
jgi:hypothetical protein